MKGTSDCDPTLVREWGDDETSSCTHVFIAIEKCGLNLANHTLLLCFIFKVFVRVSQLFLPVEIVYACAILFP